jgi:hypothetical protein
VQTGTGGFDKFTGHRWKLVRQRLLRTCAPTSKAGKQAGVDRSVCCSSRTFQGRRGASEKTRDGFNLMVLPCRSVSDVLVGFLTCGVPKRLARRSSSGPSTCSAPCCTTGPHSVLHTRPVLAPPESSMSATPSAAASPGYLCARPQ